MKEYFKEQLDNATPLTAEIILKLIRKDKGNGEDVEPGDRMLMCLIETITSVNDDKSKNIQLETMRVYESELESFNEQYTFLRHNNTIPIFKNKGI